MAMRASVTHEDRRFEQLNGRLDSGLRRLVEVGYQFGAEPLHGVFRYTGNRRDVEALEHLTDIAERASNVSIDDASSDSPIATIIDGGRSSRWLYLSCHTVSRQSRQAASSMGAASHPGVIDSLDGA